MRDRVCIIIRHKSESSSKFGEESVISPVLFLLLYTTVLFCGVAHTQTDNSHTQVCELASSENENSTRVPNTDAQTDNHN